MTKYDVTAWCSVPYYTTFEVDAANIQEALEKAKLQAPDEFGESCGSEFPWDEFEIDSDDESLNYMEPPRRAKNAAAELRDELQRGINLAQQVVDSWEHGDLAVTVRALSQWLDHARVALDQATKP